MQSLAWVCVVFPEDFLVRVLLLLLAVIAWPPTSDINCQLWLVWLLPLLVRVVPINIKGQSMSQVFSNLFLWLNFLIRKMSRLQYWVSWRNRRFEREKRCVMICAIYLLRKGKTQFSDVVALKGGGCLQKSNSKGSRWRNFLPEGLKICSLTGKVLLYYLTCKCFIAWPRKMRE